MDNQSGPCICSDNRPHGGETTWVPSQTGGPFWGRKRAADPPANTTRLRGEASRATRKVNTAQTANPVFHLCCSFRSRYLGSYPSTYTEYLGR